MNDFCKLPDTDSDCTFETAIAWAELGWHVVPMKPDRSRAYVKYARQPLPSADQVAVWFQQWPDSLLTIRLPKVVAVLDIDPRDRPLEDILAELRHTFSLPDGPALQTPRGGQHLWFRLPEGVEARNWTSKHGRFQVEGVDIRTNGGLATVPPSRRADGSYAWVSWMNNIPLAPKGLVKALIPPPVRENTAPPEVPKALFKDGRRADAYAARVLEDELASVMFALPGGRNHTLFVASANLGSLHAGGLLPDVRRLLENAAEKSGLTKDDGIGATQATIRSGWKKGLENPRQLFIGGPDA